MSTHLQLFEHEEKPYVWSDRDLGLIERVNLQAGDEVLRATANHGKRQLKAGSYVGVVRLGRNTIQIMPKIYRTSPGADEADLANQATRNLLNMLNYAGDLPVHEHGLAPLTQRDLDWFEILTQLFASHLAEAWQRGPFRAYQSFDDDLPVLKGKWRIGEHIRHPERQHRLAVTYDEFTADNALNRVFRYVVERLWHLTRDTDNRQRLGQLRQWQQEVTLLSVVTPAQVSTITLTRLNQPYLPLLNLARLFLQHATLQPAAGELETFTLLFDMNTLFQDFIAGFIQRHRTDILPAALYDSDLLPQTRGEERALARRTGGGPAFRLIPDLAFRDRAGEFPVLLDTKYKILDAADRKLGVSQGDFYQMHAYLDNVRLDKRSNRHNRRVGVFIDE